MDVKNKNLLTDQSGQALLEFLAFLPFIIMMYLITITLGGAIFGSINQQKAARGYLFARVKNNSYLPRPGYAGADVDDAELPWRGWERFGTYFIGWKEKFAGAGSPLASCYKLNLPTKDIEKKCESYGKQASQYIRVMTVYGICGATYFVKEGADVYHTPWQVANEVANVDACTIK